MECAEGRRAGPPVPATLDVPGALATGRAAVLSGEYWVSDAPRAEGREGFEDVISFTVHVPSVVRAAVEPLGGVDGAVPPRPGPPVESGPG